MPYILAVFFFCLRTEVGPSQRENFQIHLIREEQNTDLCQKRKNSKQHVIIKHILRFLVFGRVGT